MPPLDPSSRFPVLQVLRVPLPSESMSSSRRCATPVSAAGLGGLKPGRPRRVELNECTLRCRTPSPAPYCPTPDYDSDSSGSTLHTASTAWSVRAATGEASAAGVLPEVEMQSLDSLELLEPRARQPRPPQTYFQQDRCAEPACPPRGPVGPPAHSPGDSRRNATCLKRLEDVDSAITVPCGECRFLRLSCTCRLPSFSSVFRDFLYVPASFLKTPVFHMVYGLGLHPVRDSALPPLS